MLPMGPPARADCGPPGGPVVTCAPPGTGGYFGPFDDNLTVNIQLGTTVTDNGNPASILVQNGNTITNNGTVQATGNADGIEARDNNKVSNNGAIQVVDDNAIELFNQPAVAAQPNVVNNGSITISGSAASTTS
jgi:hypothetical protein